MTCQNVCRANGPSTFPQVLPKLDRWCPVHDGWTDGSRPIYCPAHHLFTRDGKHRGELTAGQWRGFKPPLTLSHSLVYLPNTVNPHIMNMNWYSHSIEISKRVIYDVSVWECADWTQPWTLHGEYVGYLWYRSESVDLFALVGFGVRKALWIQNMYINDEVVCLH